jgi:signal transduction histidine kinase
MTSSDDLRDQLDSLHSISVEIAALHEISDIEQRALDYCLQLTVSEFGFIGLLVDGPRVMDVAAIEGFERVDEEFYDQFHVMAVRRSVVGVTIQENRPTISNDVPHDPNSVGQPPGHPPVRKFLGVPLRVGTDLIGMVGVANKSDGYDSDDERILTTFANQVAVAIDNARLYERQREMITSLEQLHVRLDEAERTQLLTRERERIAGQLHDQIEQEVFSIGLGINSLLEGDDIDQHVADRLRAIRRLSVTTADEVRRAIFALAVPGHGEGDLVSEVQSLLRELERRSELETHLVVSGSPLPRLGEPQDVLVSVVNEALSNVERHARAGTVLISIRYEDDRLDLVIQDDGVGVPDLVLNTFPDSYLHFGLRHMRQRIVEFGGTFEVGNGEEAGTIIRVSLPVSEAAG